MLSAHAEAAVVALACGHIRRAGFHLTAVLFGSTVPRATHGVTAGFVCQYSIIAARRPHVHGTTWSGGDARGVLLRHRDAYGGRAKKRVAQLVFLMQLGR